MRREQCKIEIDLKLNEAGVKVREVGLIWGECSVKERLIEFA